ncbi:MAG: hypothetical protein E5V63_04255 [Mesorhizobium sp.]|nr:MAG: hypothetical protein E5V63_04255 [Mesorhizobium sp.]
MSYRDWHAGMKVVCVDNSGDGKDLDVGRIYTLASIYKAVQPNRSAPIFVDLVESPSNGWFPWRFRPLQAKKTDISLFTAMLNKRKAREPV